MKLLNKKFINIIFSIIGLTIIIYLVYKLKVYSGEVDFSQLHFNFTYLILSFLMIPIWFVLMCYIWKTILYQFKEKISLIDSMRIIGISMFGKYIPGKVWFTVGRIMLAERVGVSKKHSFFAVILETYFFILTGMVFFFILITQVSVNETLKLWSFIFMFLIIPFIIPFVFTKILNFVLKKMKKTTIDITLKFSFIIKIFILYIFIWLIQGFEFLLLIKSFYILPINNIALISIYPAAWSIGFLMLVMPAGLGIRDSFITIALLQLFPKEYEAYAIIGALLSRIEITIGEFLYLFTLIGSKKLWRNNDKET